MPAFYRPRDVVDSRARTLALWLLTNSDQVNGPEKLQIVFNCAGKTASVELKERKPVKIEQLNGNLSDLLGQS